MIKILLADDHPLVRRGLRDVLREDPDNIVVAEARDGEDALNKILHYKPDMVFIDINMPHKDGIEVIRNVRKKYPGISFIVLTIHDNQHYYKEAIETGVKGYLLKDYALTEIKDCMNTVRQGKNYLSRYMDCDENTGCTDVLKKITRREKEILRELMDGSSNRKLAEKFFCSEKNIERIKTKLRKKLDLPPTYNALLSWAMQNRKLL
ncbi:response regulator transcription factor [Sinomicrobium sp. M5D2P17]